MACGEEKTKNTTSSVLFYTKPQYSRVKCHLKQKTKVS